MESDRVHARAVDHARGGQPRGRARRRARLAGLADATAASRRSPASTRARSCATSASAGAMRGGVFPARRREARGARAASHAEPPMAGRDLAREVTPAERHASTATATARGSRRSTPASRARSCATSSQRGARVELHPVHGVAPRTCWPTTPTRSSSPTGPATRPRSTTSSTRVRELVGKQPVFGHLPRPPAALPRRRPGDLQAAVRPPRRQPPGQGPRDRPHRDHLAEPRLRGRRPDGGAQRSTPTSRCAGRPTSAPPSSATSTSTTAPSRA